MLQKMLNLQRWGITRWFLDQESASEAGAAAGCAHCSLQYGLGLVCSSSSGYIQVNADPKLF